MKERWQDVALDALSRVAAACALGYFAYGQLVSALTSFKVQNGLLLVAESIAVVLVIIARRPRSVRRRVYPMAITLGATFYFLLLDREHGAEVSVAAGTALQVVGICLQLGAKLWLGRSFGLLPANRGVVSTGPYRLMRHPMYFGYFLTHVGFFLGNANLHNALLYLGLELLQVLRVLEEEKLLLEDPEYAAYAERVRWRFLPFVF